jgi:hypothetical protein
MGGRNSPDRPFLVPEETDQAVEQNSTSDPLLPPFTRPAEVTPSDIPRLDRLRLHSAILPDPYDRGIAVYLPRAYFSEPNRSFPVFYLHDGQNLFDERTSYVPGHPWHAHTTADRLTENGEIEPIILVGVANTGIRRMAEYTPTRDFKLGGGEGRSYARLLIEELQPSTQATARSLALPQPL